MTTLWPNTLNRPPMLQQSNIPLMPVWLPVALPRQEPFTLPPPSDDTGSSLAELSEEVLVQKANLALDLAHEHGSPTPPKAQFISAQKTANKIVLYEVNTEETVAWL